jgi:hypothetical protein
MCSLNTLCGRPFVSGFTSTCLVPICSMLSYDYSLYQFARFIREGFNPGQTRKQGPMSGDGSQVGNTNRDYRVFKKQKNLLVVGALVPTYVGMPSMTTPFSHHLSLLQALPQIFHLTVHNQICSVCTNLHHIDNQIKTTNIFIS